MNTQQPKALRLANWLIDGEPYNAAPEAATELRRLHSVNAQLLEALKQAEPLLQSFLDNITRAFPQYKKIPALDQVRAAITKAQETV